MEALSDLLLIWAAVYVAVVAARKTRLTPVLYFLFLGFIMVNVGLPPTDSHPFVRGFAELGIIVIMFTLGFEESTSNFLQSIKKSWGIAFFGALAPFVVAYSVAEYFGQDTNLALMCGLAMTATAPCARDGRLDQARPPHRTVRRQARALLRGRTLRHAGGSHHGTRGRPPGAPLRVPSGRWGLHGRAHPA